MTRDELLEIAGMLKALRIHAGEYGIWNNVLDYCIARLTKPADDYAPNVRAKEVEK